MKQIIICTNGWIVLGETTQTEKTIDPLPRTEIERTAVIMTLDCDA